MESLKPEKLHPDTLNQKQFIFTLHDGKLFPSKETLVNENHGRFLEFSAEEPSVGKEAEDEIHIEIFRDKLQLDPKNIEEGPINNISSAYESFWKTEFEECLEQRKCTKCGRVCLTPQQLCHHMQHLHHCSFPEQCFVCLQLFVDKQENTQHLLQSHLVDKPLSTCEVCFEVFGDESQKSVHRSVHTVTDKCNWCSASFPCRYLLNQHLYYCSLRKNDQDCHICGCYFRSSHIRQLHSLRHNRVTCEICHINLSSDSNSHVEDTEVVLMRHLRIAHSDDEVKNYLEVLKNQDQEEETLDKLFMSQVQSNLTQFNDTLISQVNQRPQIQQASPKNSIPAETTFEDNTSSQPSENNLQCLECLKVFENKEELVKHEIEHQQPYSCEECGIKFIYRRGFKAHMRSHGVKVKPSSIRYKCKQCSVNCPTLSCLRIHILTHTNQKTLLCDICGMKFRRPHALKAHQDTVHNVRRSNSCPYCGATSLSRKSLLRHIQCVHGGVRRFICGVCGTRFLQNQDLRRHLRSSHKQNYPPLSSFLKKSKSEIHVIPSMDKLDPADPHVNLLKSIVREEQLKLEAFNQRIANESIEPINQNRGVPMEEPQSLNILGDVASKATPINYTNITETSLKVSPDSSFPKLKEFPTNLAQCCPKTTIPCLPQENCLDDNTSVKPSVMYPLATSISSTSSTIPYQFFMVPNHSIGSDFQVASGVSDAKTVDHPILQRLTVEQLLSYSMPSDISLDKNVPVCLVEKEAEASFSGSEDILSAKYHTGALDINTEGSSRLPHIEILCPSLSFQEDFLTSLESGSSLVDTMVMTSQEQIESSKNQKDFEQTENSLILCDNQKISSPKQTPHSDHLENNITALEERKIDESCEIKLPCNHFDTQEVSSGKLSQINLPRNKIVRNMAHKRSQGTLPDGSIRSPEQGFCTNGRQSEASLNSSKQLKSVLKSKHLTNSNFLGDKNVASGEKICPECGKEFYNTPTLRRHLQLHYGDKTHECSLCGKHFRYKCNLTAHLRTHSEDRPYKCPVVGCKRNFRSSKEVKEHTLLHEKSQPFKCENCGKGFARQRDLRRHSLSHSGYVKPTCYICRKSFSRVDYLKTHMKSHKQSEDILSPQERKTKPCINKKHSEDSVFSVACGLCFERISSEQERAVHQERCKGKVEIAGNTSPSVFVNPQDLSEYRTKSDHVPIVESNVSASTSEDLISLAYQAAEDGVEFIFVEEVENLVQEEYNPNQNDDDNIIFVQIVESDD